jgi:site-specific DNA-methyltransferase (adenine-specific)
MTKILLVNQKIEKFSKEYTGKPFECILTDPPYCLDSIMKRFGSSNGSAPAQFGRDGAFSRASKGFMGKQWDDDVVFKRETWEMLGGMLARGGFGAAFAASRGWHNMACAIEDAGLTVSDTLFTWVYSSGMPKATRIDAHLKRRGDQTYTIWEGHRYGLQVCKPAGEPFVILGLRIL